MKDFAISGDAAVQRQLDRLAQLSLPQGRVGLEVIRELLARFGNPQLAIPPVLHVAGTNGKGSTCAYLRAMLEAEGLTVHVATKPHLVRYNERIRVAGALISDAMLASLLEEVLDASADLGPSFFEVTTAATFLAFHRVPADAVVLEVGLGGRFDATNVLEHPAACGIASLGIDHEAFLLNEDAGAPADPMCRIAFEKAGIARAGSPLVTQAYAPDVAAQVEASAAAAGAPLFMRGRDWFADISPDGIAYRDAHGALSLPLPAMQGAHQADNAALAVAILRHARISGTISNSAHPELVEGSSFSSAAQPDARRKEQSLALQPCFATDKLRTSGDGLKLPISDEAFAQGIIRAFWPARLQVLKPGPLTCMLPARRFLLDGGHNPDAAEALAKYLGAAGSGPVDAVMGMMAAKDARRFLRILAPHLASVTAVPIPGSDHLPTDALAMLAAEAGVARNATAPDVASALEMLSGEGGPVLIAGSLYLAGKVLSANRELPY